MCNGSLSWIFTTKEPALIYSRCKYVDVLCTYDNRNDSPISIVFYTGKERFVSRQQERTLRLLGKNLNIELSLFIQWLMYMMQPLHCMDFMGTNDTKSKSTCILVDHKCCNIEAQITIFLIKTQHFLVLMIPITFLYLVDHNMVLL